MTQMAEARKEYKESNRAPVAVRVKKGAPKDVEGYVHECLEVAWVPPLPRVSRQDLMLEAVHAIKTNMLTSFCAPVGSGATSLMQEASHQLANEHVCTYRISLKTIDKAQVCPIVATTRRALAEAKVGARRCVVFFDDLEDIVSEQVGDLAREFELLASRHSVVITLRPRARLLLDALGQQPTFVAKDLCVQAPELSAFMVEAVLGGRDISKQWLQQTKGVISLAEALFEDGRRASQKESSELALRASELLEASYTHTILQEESRVLGAMILMGSGSFRDVEALGVRHVFEIAEALADDFPILGINVPSAHFEVVQVYTPQKAIQSIATRDQELMFKTLAHLVQTKRVRLACNIVKVARFPFSHPRVKAVFCEVDPVVLFNTLGTCGFLEVCDDAPRLLASKNFGGFKMVRESLATLKTLSLTNCEPYKHSHELFYQHARVMTSLKRKSSATLSERFFAGKPRLKPTGIMECVVLVEQMVSHLYQTQQVDASQQKELMEISACLQELQENKLALYARAIPEVALVFCGVHEKTSIALLEEAYHLAHKASDTVIEAVCLLGMGAWHLQAGFLQLAEAYLEKGERVAKKAGARAITLALAMLQKTAAVLKNEQTGMREFLLPPAPSLSSLFSLYVISLQNEHAFKKLWRSLSFEYKQQWEIYSSQKRLSQLSWYSYQQKEAQTAMVLQDNSLLPAPQNERTLRVMFLGGTRMYLGEKLLVSKDFRRRAARDILEILALETKHKITRARLLELLWPGAPQKRAKASLYTAISDLKKAVGDLPYRVPHIVCDRDWICLNMDVSQVDIDTFSTLVSTMLDPAEHMSARLASARNALKTYRGGLVYTPNHSLFAHMHYANTTLKVRLIDAYKQAVRVANDVRLTEDACLFAEAAYALEPSREDLFVLYADALREVGRFSEAEALYKTFVETYATEGELSARTVQALAKHTLDTGNKAKQAQCVEKVV